MRSHASGLGWTIGIAVAAACSAACNGDAAQPEASATCSPAWYRMIDEKVATSDGAGHGPDVGSDEWKSTVEFRLGIRGKPDVPARDSEAWCRHVDSLVQRRGRAYVFV